MRAGSSLPYNGPIPTSRQQLENRKNDRAADRTPFHMLPAAGLTPTKAPAAPPPPPPDQNSSAGGNATPVGTPVAAAAAAGTAMVTPGSGAGRQRPPSGLHRPKQFATPEQAVAAQEAAGARMFRNSQDAQRRARERAAALPEGCTFKPKTTAAARNSADKTTGQARIDRMYHAEVKRRAELRRRADLPGDECTFKPALSPGVARLKGQKGDGGGGGGSGSGSALQGNGARGQARVDRMYEEHKKKQAQLSKRRDEEATAGCTFKPRITKTGAQRSTKGGLRADPARAFAAIHEKRMAQRRKNEAARAAREMEGCTFSPSVNKQQGNTEGKASSSPPASPGTAAGEGSTAAGSTASSSSSSSSPSAFAARQAAFETQRRAKMDALRKAKAEEELIGATFHPCLAPTAARATTTAAAAADASGSGGGSGESVHERLFRQNGMNEQKLRSMREAEAAACTFKPAVSDRAHSCGRVRPRGTSVFDMLHSDNEVRLRAALKLEEQRAAREVAECTHTPVISEASRSVARGASRARGEQGQGKGKGGKNSIFERLSAGGAAAGGGGGGGAEAAGQEGEGEAASPGKEIVHAV